MHRQVLGKLGVDQEYYQMIMQVLGNLASIMHVTKHYYHMLYTVIKQVLGKLSSITLLNNSTICCINDKASVRYPWDSPR